MLCVALKCTDERIRSNQITNESTRVMVVVMVVVVVMAMAMVVVAMVVVVS